MTAVDYNELIEALSIGHEFGFKYHDKEYYIEYEDSSYVIYDVTDQHNGILLDKIAGKNIYDLIRLLMEKPFIEGKSFNEIYAYLEYVDID